MAIVTDTFTDTAGTNLASHTGEQGATWTKQSIFATGEFVISDQNRVRLGSTATQAIFYASGTPPSAEYDLSVDFHCKSVAGDFWGVLARASNGQNNGYRVEYDIGNSAFYFHRLNADAPGDLLLGAYVQALIPGVSYTVTMEIRAALKRVLIDGVERITSTDDVTNQIGQVGLEATSTAAPSNSTGIHFDNMVCTDASRRFLLVR